MPQMDSQSRTTKQVQRVPSEADEEGVERREIPQHQPRAIGYFVGAGSAFYLRGRAI